MYVTFRTFIYNVEGPKFGGPTNRVYYDIDCLGAPELTRKQRYKVIRKYKNMSDCGEVKDFEMNEPISLGHLQSAAAEAFFQPVASCCAPKRSTNMYNTMQVQEVTADDKARDHLRERLYDVYAAKDQELRTKYGIDYTSPKTRQELADALKAGQYTISGLEKHGDDKLGWRSATDFIRWTLVPEDKDGYEKAHKALDAAREATKDTIIVSSPAEGLTAFRAFEAQTFS